MNVLMRKRWQGVEQSVTRVVLARRPQADTEQKKAMRRIRVRNETPSKRHSSNRDFARV